MKIEIDLTNLKDLIDIHMSAARIWGSITAGLLQFILLGASGSFYLSLVPWVVFCFINSMAKVQ